MEGIHLGGWHYNGFDANGPHLAGQRLTYITDHSDRAAVREPQSKNVTLPAMKVVASWLI